MCELAVSNWVGRARILVGSCALVALVVFAVSNSATRRLRVGRELARLGGEVDGKTAETLTRQRSEGVWARMVKRIEAGGLDLGDTAESEIAKLMRSAGYMSATAPRIYTLVRQIGRAHA